MRTIGMGMLLAVVLATGAQAQTTTSSSTSTSSTTSTSTSTSVPAYTHTGQFVATQTATGASGVVVCPLDPHARTLTMEAVISGTATVTLQQRILGGAGFNSVGTALTATGSTSVTNPTGCYVANVTACSSCTVGPVRWEWR